MSGREDTDALRELLYGLERRLLQPETRHSELELKTLLAEDFVEFGSGGDVYDRRQIIEELSREESIRFSIADFRIRRLSNDIVLATYTATPAAAEGAPEWRSLRSSLWKRTGDRWQMVFHQGTQVPTDHC